MSHSSVVDETHNRIDSEWQFSYFDTKENEESTFLRFLDKEELEGDIEAFEQDKRFGVSRLLVIEIPKTITSVDWGAERWGGE